MIDLVTGASGFIGSTLVRRLVSEGRTVRVLLRPGSRRDLLGRSDDAIHVVHGDVTDAESLERALDGVHRVFHCAGRVGFGGAREASRLYLVNVTGTANVVDTAIRAGIGRLVHVSSISATGRSADSGAPVTEETPWTETRDVGAYARSKRLAELEVHRAVAEGLDAVIVNPSLVFGVGRTGENTMRIVELVQRGLARAYPAGATNVVDVEDVVDGMLLAAARGTAGRRFILGGENLTWRRILDTLADALGQRRPRFRIPPVVLGLAGAISELIPNADLARESARTACAHIEYDSSRAREELGWTPRTFEETARRIASRLAT